MENSRLSIDSLGESEVQRLTDKLRQKERIINEKSEIINSLRQQVNDLNKDVEEMENDQQVLRQRLDRLSKELSEKNEEIEAISHARNEIESSYDTLNKRMEARTCQVQKFVEELAVAKKDLEEARDENEQLKHKNEQLKAELDMANARKRSYQELEQEKEHQEHVQQLVQQKSQEERLKQMRYQQQQQQQNRQVMNRTLHEDNRHEPVSALHFQMADEVGEIMDSSSALPPAKFTTTSTNHDQYQRSISDPLTWEQQRRRQQQQQSQRHDNRNYDNADKMTAAYLNETTLRPMRETLHVNDVNYCPNHFGKRSHQYQSYEEEQQQQHQKQQQPQKVHHDQNELDNDQYFDPIAQRKMNAERAIELARRNKLTKPLHQTSYALELDTFDTTDLTEFEIKRGNVTKQPLAMAKDQLMHQHHHQHHSNQLTRKPPQRQAPEPPTTRKPLANFSNTPPRRVYKKAEAFIV